MKNNLHEKLKTMRIEKRLSQIQVATLLGMQCQNRVSRWEKGIAIPSVYNLQKLAKVYGVSMEHLLS